MVVVEGEKTAEAAKLLAPDCVVVTWEGGARNVQTTDWSPLAERDVVVVPDADDEGRKAAQEVITHIRLSHDLLAGRANAPRPSRRVVAELPPDILHERLLHQKPAVICREEYFHKAVIY